MPQWEANQLAGNIRNWASEGEAAGSVAINELHRMAVNIAEGRAAIPPKVIALSEQPKPAPMAAPATALMFLTQHVGWYDAEGGRHRAASMNDAELPLHLIAKARAIGAAHDITSPLRKQHHGSKTSAPPEWHWVKWLNEDPKAKSHVEPVLHSAFAPHPDYVNAKPKTFTVKTAPAEPMAATRSMEDDGTVEVVLSRGTAVTRFYGREVLEISTDAINLNRIKAGCAPLLDSHRQDSIFAAVGRIDSAWVEKQDTPRAALVGQLAFHETREGKIAERMVARGEISAVSI